MLKVNLQQSSPIPLDVELHCKNGEILALVGPSGAGKSTVLRCIAGLHSAKFGQINCSDQVWFDRDNKKDFTPQQRRIGMVFQNYALFPHLTVYDNIRLALAEQSQSEKKIAQLLEQVHLTGLEQRYPNQLSGGQQQRVAIARALAREPEVLLLDEPFSAVDKVTRRKLYLELNTLRRSLDMPIILVTHDLDEAAMLADSICVIHNGKTLQQGQPDQVLHSPKNVEVARQVDVRNLSIAKLVDVEGSLKLKWHEYLLNVDDVAEFTSGQTVHWIVSPAKILLHQRVRPSRGEHENPVTGVIQEMITLKGITTVLLIIEDTHNEMLQMDVPEHVAMRNKLLIGDSITVSILSDAIHLMQD
ncbi:ABC transporter [Methylophaga sp. 42_25_T18]|nr:ABC transporter [Methylophaga sp. 42_25_T18]OUR89061.1 ABC transporter [Methylophaga sp. 42_8_T64]